MGRNTTGPPSRVAPSYVVQASVTDDDRRRQTPESNTSLALLHYVQASHLKSVINRRTVAYYVQNATHGIQSDNIELVTSPRLCLDVVVHVRQVLEVRGGVGFD